MIVQSIASQDGGKISFFFGVDEKRLIEISIMNL
jgi:hypothetical protein